MLNPDKDSYYLKKYNLEMGDLQNKVGSELTRPTYDGEVEPPFPNLNDDIKTIQGIDKNKNGIRDDVEIWINRTFNKYNHRKALKAYVLAKYNIMDMAARKSEISYEDLKKLYVDKENSFNCFMAVSVLDMNRHWQIETIPRLNKVLLNTYQRKKTYEIYVDRLSSINGVNNIQNYKFSNNGNVILDACQFKVENRNLIYESFPDYMKK